MKKLRKLYEEKVIGLRSPFRIQNAGQNDYDDIENIDAFQKGCYKMIYDKYSGLLDKTSIPYVNNNQYLIYQAGATFLVIGGMNIVCRSLVLKSLSTISLCLYSSIFYQNQRVLGHQTFLLQNFHKFTQNEQRALRTGNSNYFYESFGDLKKDTKTKKILMI